MKENEYMCHVYVRADGLVGVCVSDEEYQTRVAHSLITKILDDFAGQGRISSFLEATLGFFQFPPHVKNDA